MSETVAFSLTRFDLLSVDCHSRCVADRSVLTVSYK